VTRSHSTPHVDPVGGDPLSSERFLYGLLAAVTLLTVALVIVGWAT
jgi:hypothetical protein